MVEIKVNANNKEYSIQFDDQNKTVTNNQNLKELASYLGVTPSALESLFKNSELLSDQTYSLQDLVNLAVDKEAQNEVDVQLLIEKGEAAGEQVKHLEKSITALEAKLAEAEKATAKDTALISNLKKQIEDQKQMKSSLELEVGDAQKRVEKALENKNITMSAEIKKAAMKFAEVKLETTASEDGQGPSSSKAGTLGGTPTSGGSAGTGKATTFGDGAKAGTFGGSGDSSTSFDPMSMMKAQWADDNLLSLVDMSGEAKKRQQMMLLFFHYARMAMSGDLYAMYQFMRFLSYVIGRDKALQNVAIGTKLIELQEVSRRAQEALTGLKVGEDSQSQADFQAKLQQIRGEENMVATSQKLLTQMMEEYTGIKSSLDDVTKSMLDSWASSLKSSSTWRI